MKKKRLKGMTLMEVIVAMVVMTICGALLVEAAVCVVNNTRTARRVTSKVDEQASDVVNRPEAITAYETGAAIHLQYNGNSGDIVIDKYEAPTTQLPEEQRADNLKYFKAVPVTTS